MLALFERGLRVHGACTVNEAALRRAGGDEETNDPDVAYARFPESVPARYRDGLLPGG